MQPEVGEAESDSYTASWALWPNSFEHAMPLPRSIDQSLSDYVFYFAKAEWRIPGERMKMREQHIVPLSRQAIEILQELEPLTNREIPAKPDAPRYVFPGAQSRLRPMSENAILAALRRMGYPKEEMTGHGFRSMASTLLHE